MYSHLFFDLDHTLWDFEANARNAWWQLYNDYDLAHKGFSDFDLFLDSYLGHNERMWLRFRRGQIRRKDLHWKRIAHVFYDFNVVNKGLVLELSDAFIQLLPTQTQLMEGTIDVLEYCKGKYELNIITNGYEATQITKLSNSGILPYFKEVFSSERCQSVKPQAEIFRYANKFTNSKEEQSLMIGDGLAIDVLGAANAGWHQVYFNPKAISHKGKPTYEIQRLCELFEIV